MRAATVIQSIFRSYSVRFYLRNECNYLSVQRGIRPCDIDQNVKKSIALKKVTIDQLNKRKRNRQSLICMYYELSHMISDVTCRQLKSLKRLNMKYEAITRKKRQLHEEQIDEGTVVLVNYTQRFEDRRIHFQEIKSTIEDQISFMNKLSSKSHTLTKRSNTKLKRNEEIWKELQHASDIVNKEVQSFDSTLFAQERDALVHALIRCDLVQELILETECSRYEEELETIDISNEMCIQMLETILSIEMWEAERFGIHKTVMTRAKPFSAEEASIYFQLIDDNQMKLNRTRRVDLHQICEIAGDFYYTQQQKLDLDDYPHIQGQTPLPINTTLVDVNDNIVSITEWLEQFHKKLIQVQQGCYETNKGALQSDEQIKNRVKATQQYIRERREILLMKSMSNPDESIRSDYVSDTINAKPNNLDKIKWDVFGHSKWFTKVNRNTTALFKRNKRRLSLFSSKLNNGTQKVVPIIKRLTMIGQDQELRMLTTVVKKTMNNQINNNVVGIVSLMFTVGKEETQLFSAKNDQNEAQGRSFYQSRLELGKHVETVLWVQISSKYENFITNINLRNRSTNEIEDGVTDEFIGHKNLDCILCVERNPGSTKIVSSMQISYVTTSDHETLKKDYKKISTPLSNFGLAEAYLWIAHTDRSMKNATTNLNRMHEQLDEYKNMLPIYPNDSLLQSLIKELERRIEITRRKEKEQCGLTHDHIGYITEFLAMSEQDLKGFKGIFNKIDKDKDGVIDVQEIVGFAQESLSMTPIIKDCLNLSLGISDFINDKLSFGEFTRAIGCFAMFSATEMLKCIYCVVDKQSRGHIHQSEFYSLLTVLHPKKNIETASRSLKDATIPEFLSYPSFEALASKYPKLLFPMFRFQESIRTMCLGTKWWDRKMRKFHYAKEKVLLDQANR